MSDKKILNKNVIEKQALIIGIIINLIMAFSGWIAYHLSNSQALLLDGIFSFITFLSILVAIKVSTIRSHKTTLFPFGQFIYEALYSLLKGIMIVGVLSIAFISNISKITSYINGKNIAILKIDIILIYSILITILCFSLAAYYKYKNYKIKYLSTILQAEYSSAVIDGFLSASIGVALVGINLFSINGSFGFLYYIGDALLVIVLVILLGKTPLILIRNSFIEIAGGTLRNQAEKQTIENILKNYLSTNNLLINSYISKTGSSYLIIACINTDALDKIGFIKMQQIKQKIIKKLTNIYQNVMFEIILH